jgi:hypothetical protein
MLTMRARCPAREMAKPLSLTIDSRVYALAGSPGADVVLDRFEASIGSTGIDVVARVNRLFRSSIKYDCAFDFEEATMSLVESGRSAGKAAVGAIAGTLLAGPLGLIAGAALGGRKSHLIFVHDDGDNLLLDVSGSELKMLLARGLLAP